MTTLIDVLDSAVKIGLGAAISGLATYATMSAKTKQDILLDTLRKRREILEGVAEQTEYFTNAILRYWAAMVELARNRELKQKSTNLVLDKIEIAATDIVDGAKYLSGAEAKLLLLGYEESQNLLRDYGEFCIAFRRSIWPEKEELYSGEIEQKKSEILDKRKLFFDSLRDAYEKQ